MGNASNVFAYSSRKVPTNDNCFTDIHGKCWKSDGRATVLEIPFMAMYYWGYAT